MQMASSLMQMVAAGHWLNILQIHCLFEVMRFTALCFYCIRMGITVFIIFIWVDILSDIRS